MPTPDPRPSLPEPGEPIHLRLTSIAQLLNTVDPSPFRDADLSPEAERYLVKLVREVPRKEPVRIVVHVPGPEPQIDLGAALREHFAFRAQEQSSETRELFRFGRRAMTIGLAILAVCNLIAFRLASSPNGHPLSSILQDSFIIVGWVAMWRPAEVFLYDWLPLARRQFVFARLSNADVSVRVA